MCVCIYVNNYSLYVCVYIYLYLYCVCEFEFFCILCRVNLKSTPYNLSMHFTYTALYWPQSVNVLRFTDNEPVM